MNHFRELTFKKNILIFAPFFVFAGVAASFLFSDPEAAAGGAQIKNEQTKMLRDAGEMAMAAAERTGLLPAQTYAAIYPEFNLPQNGDKTIVPAKKANPAGLIIRASSSLAIDKASGAVLWEKNSSAPRPIASITKLMSALVFLDSGADWEKVYELRKEDVRLGGKSHIYPGDKVQAKDLFYLALVGSDNTAAVALARSSGLTEEEFAARMNEQAKNFGLKRTFFRDVSGLSAENVSTAEEVAVLARKCLARKMIRDASLEEKYEFKTAGGRAVEARSTDYLLSSFPDGGISIFGGKTGHTEEAGYCFVGDFKNEAGREIISVVMGAGSDEERFSQTKKLVEWAYGNYDWTAGGD